ncbi:hypothetical protein M9H77_26115 [Catharanthus roseus]|uniref:Uncharacterized protein n=1 Tax=Catharanthus roseus TaxID=4058 RepID=A0ACC0AA48_CATRO|nr:hypothetical protein M9H77_26115 [Catharanthus roseus]
MDKHKYVSEPIHSMSSRMKNWVILCFTILTFHIILEVEICGASSSRLLFDDDEAEHELFEQWMVQHGRDYKNEAEKAQHFWIFKQTLKFVEAFNSVPGRSSAVGLNDFADQTPEELATNLGFAFRSLPPTQF